MWIVAFNIFGQTFFDLLYYIPLRNCEDCNIIYDTIIQSLELNEIQISIIKNLQFVSNVTNSAQELVQVKMKNVLSSNQLRLFIERIKSW